MPRGYRVVATPERFPDDRDFGAKLAYEGEEIVLLVPQKLLPLLVDRVINESEMLYALVMTDPRAVAHQLDWSLSQVTKSFRGLKAVLQNPPIRPSKKRTG
ncbi:hypothetical protein IPH19_01540 [Candidatus Uhrbacteria bacterium]|jgi:hypothetical protein|nr:MAG: hypothetical protein IPH19_01540 [Candidatus Uhrbacteria bacterium]